jgi:hypothetical protein
MIVLIDLFVTGPLLSLDQKIQQKQGQILPLVTIVAFINGTINVS